MKKWIINILYPPNFLDLFDKLQKDYKLTQLYEPKNLQNPDLPKSITATQVINYNYQKELYNFLAGISLHEFGHSKECPIDSNYFSAIIQAVSTALMQKNSFNRKIMNYFVNLFSDIIVNTLYGLNSKYTFFRNSIFTFYYSELIQFESADLAFYFFILLNLKLYQFHIPIRSAIENILLPKLPQDFPDILDQLIEIFCPFKNLTKILEIGVEPTENEKWKIINHLTERENWAKMAYRFTEILSDFASENLLETHQPIPNFFIAKEFLENETFQREILSKILEQKFEQQKVPSKRSKAFERQEKKPKAVEKYPGEASLNLGLEMFNEYTQFDEMYQYRAKKMEIKIPKTKESTKYAIAWMSREIMTEKDNIANFDPLNVFFLPQSEELLLFKRTLPLKHDLNGVYREKGFPNLALFCDDSGSMDWEPYKGTGKYDAVIITIYSLLNWLKSKTFAPVIKYNLTCFSDTTRSTGWLDYYHINEVKHLLFIHQGGGTELNPIEFEKILEDPKKKASILITDGEIFNYKEVLNVLKKYRSNILFLFIQIGKFSKFAKILKTKDYNVTEIKNITTLPQIVLDFVKDTYKNYEY